MKYGTQAKIAAKSGVSNAFISYFFKGEKIPSWKTAKKLGEATGTDPVLWAEGRVQEIKQALPQMDETEAELRSEP